jgi:hypothetical protein
LSKKKRNYLREVKKKKGSILYIIAFHNMYIFPELFITSIKNKIIF